MEKRFFDEYQYLIEEFSKNKYLYQEQDIYKKMFKIYRSRYELLKLHNKKYLNNTVSKLDDFFDKVSSKDGVDVNTKMMVTSLEDRMVSIVRNNYIEYIGIKLLYLSKYFNKDMSKVQIICCDDDDISSLKKELDILMNYIKNSLTSIKNNTAINRMKSFNNMEDERSFNQRSRSIPSKFSKEIEKLKQINQMYEKKIKGLNLEL